MGFLKHFLFPHFRNRYRAKLIQNGSLFVVSVLLLFLSFATPFLSKNFPEVLGVSTDITSQQLVSLTNQKRLENGASSLNLDEKLSIAAEKKAEDMFAKNYWAHNSPTGDTPWVFIKAAGYTYVYAGENLARGFNTTKDVINAWMASQDHRENMLSKNYSDVGFAVKTGRLNGEETVLVVEEFGSTTLPTVQNSETSISSPSESSQQVLPSEIVNKPLVNSSIFFPTISKAIVVLFILVFLIDLIVIEKKKVSRIVGHNIDHIFFLGLILIFLIILGKGFIL